MSKIYCFFSARYIPYLGGVERYTYNMAKELSKLGNKVIIVTSQLTGEVFYEEKDNIVIYRLPSFKLLNGRFPITKYNKQSIQIFKELRKEKIDYAVINTRFYLLSYIASVFCKNNKIPAIVIEHGTGHFTINNKLFDVLGHVYEHVITYLVRQNIKDFYGVSMECNKWLKHFNITAKGILYNAIDKNKIEELLEENNDEIINKIQYNENDIIITYTGRLIREKGILKLIFAYKKAKRKYLNLKLCIAGEGELYDKISTKNYEGVYLLGKLSFENVIGLLQLTTIFCLPTDYPEGLPTSILEAIICRCYVITSSSGGAKEIISDESYGTVTKKNEVDEIQEALKKIILDCKARSSAVEKAYERVCSEFTWSTTVNKLIKIFND